VTRLALAVLTLLIGAATAHAAETIHQFADRARGEAQKLSRDAQLVQIDVTSFSLAMDRSGWPDMSRVGPPPALLFYYLSPTTRTQIRVLVREDLTAAQQQFLHERGMGAIQTEGISGPSDPVHAPDPRPLRRVE